MWELLQAQWMLDGLSIPHQIECCLHLYLFEKVRMMLLPKNGVGLKEYTVSQCKTNVLRVTLNLIENTKYEYVRRNGEVCDST